MSDHYFGPVIIIDRYPRAHDPSKGKRTLAGGSGSASGKTSFGPEVIVCPKGPATNQPFGGKSAVKGGGSKGAAHGGLNPSKSR